MAAAHSTHARANCSLFPNAPRHSSVNGTSSAFSPSANANEDWTKISDLAERRRIQNRIAQRNYRKKLKKRLEDLERRAASASASPEPEPRQDSYSSDRFYQPRHTSDTTPTSSVRYTYSPEPPSETYNSHPTTRRKSSFPDPPDDSLMSHPAPSFSYSTYGASDIVGSSYPHSPALSSYSIPSPNHYGQYLSPRIASDSPQHSPHETSAGKQEYFDHDFGSYSMSYGSDIQHHQYQDSFANTPPLSVSDAEFDTFETSAVGSPPDMWALFPTPPPDSPPYVHF